MAWQAVCYDKRVCHILIVCCTFQLERYLRKLDQELSKFKMELEADSAGITEILEKRKNFALEGCAVLFLSFAVQQWCGLWMDKSCLWVPRWNELCCADLGWWFIPSRTDRPTETSCIDIRRGMFHVVLLFVGSLELDRPPTNHNNHRAESKYKTLVAWLPCFVMNFIGYLRLRLIIIIRLLIFSALISHASCWLNDLTCKCI